MKNDYCDCGQRVFFENTRCNACNAPLGFDPQRLSLQTLSPLDEQHWQNRDGERYRLCRNHREYNVCNWLVRADTPAHYCVSCSLNEMIPALVDPKRRQWWAELEAAKRRLIYSLLRWQLPLENRTQNPETGLGFAFLEDQRNNPAVDQQIVLSGYAQGLITINLAEADDAQREQIRVELGEAYRTLLGHLRHESGHYYFNRLVQNSADIDAFRALFGDERDDYDAALTRYYERTANNNSDWQNQFISAYAQSHPLEDWAECWAHYLHISDTLETAADFGLIADTATPAWRGDEAGVEAMLQQWVELSVALNGLNRSMGLNDAYPFVLVPAVKAKLHFVHRVVAGHRPPDPRKRPRPGAADF